MAYIESGITITLYPKLTQKGRELYFIGDDEDIVIKKFTLGDSDSNYLLARNGLKPENGLIPNLTGDNEGCIQPIANGLNIKYLINKKEVFENYCIGTILYKQERDSEGKLVWVEEPNSVECGFVFQSQPQSRSFVKNNCVNGGVGQPITISTTLGQFTSSISLDDANQKAIDYLNISGQTLANNNGVCIYNPNPLNLTLFKNCNNVQISYTVTRTTQQLINQGFQSNISVNDATNKALTWYNNPQNQITLPEYQAVICPPVSVADMYIYSPSNSVDGYFNSNGAFDFLSTPNLNFRNSYTSYNDLLTNGTVNDAKYDEAVCAGGSGLVNYNQFTPVYTPRSGNNSDFALPILTTLVHISKTNSLTNDQVVSVMNNMRIELKEKVTNIIYSFNPRYFLIDPTYNTSVPCPEYNFILNFTNSNYWSFIVEFPILYVVTGAFTNVSDPRDLYFFRDFEYRLANIPSNINVLNNNFR